MVSVLPIALVGRGGGRQRGQGKEEDRERRRAGKGGGKAQKANSHDATQLVAFPPVGAELVGVLAVDLFAAVHAVARPTDRHALRDEDGLASVGAAAARQDGFPRGRARVGSDRSGEAESWASREISG